MLSVMELSILCQDNIRISPMYWDYTSSCRVLIKMGTQVDLSNDDHTQSAFRLLLTDIA